MQRSVSLYSSGRGLHLEISAEMPGADRGRDHLTLIDRVVARLTRLRKRIEREQRQQGGKESRGA